MRKTKTTLICLPFAGGNAFSYRSLRDYLPQNIDLLTLEYPGRGKRINEKMLYDINSLIDDVFTNFRTKIELENRYLIYGHSLGGLIAYLLVKKIIENSLPSPHHLIISSCAAPSTIKNNRFDTKQMTHIQFLSTLKSLNGLPEEFFDNKELLDFFIPIIKADFIVSDTYDYVRSVPFSIPMTFISGTEEDFSETEINLWQLETEKTVNFIRLHGDHFFINVLPDKVSKIIVNCQYKNDGTL